MNVLVATHSYAGNGAAVMLLSVLEYWVRRLRWSVDTYIAPGTAAPPELLRTGARPVSAVNSAAYDFALVNTIVSADYVFQLAPQLRTVLWVHEGETVVLNSQSSAATWQQLFSLPWKSIFQTCWQTESVFTTYLTKTPPERVVCVVNGLPPIPDDVAPVAKPFGRKRILFIGGVYGRKRPQDLVAAVLALQRPDIECVFAGTTEHIQTIGAEHVEKIRAHPHIFKLVGQLERRDALALLAGSDAFCLPSADESQAIAPLEAAALGVPVLLTSLPAYNGVWAHGLNCLMHPIAGVEILRWNLAAVLDDRAVRQVIVQGAGQLPERFAIGNFLSRFTAEMPT